MGGNDPYGVVDREADYAARAGYKALIGSSHLDPARLELPTPRAGRDGAALYERFGDAVRFG